MATIEVTLDGIRYYVTCYDTKIILQVNTINSPVIYEELGQFDTIKFDKRKAKKFILRSFEAIH